jgi:subtilisin family serine protease
MKKLFILATALCTSSIAVNAENVRVVVSQDSVIKTSAMSAISIVEPVKTCLLTSDGVRKICVPTPVSKKVSSRTVGASPKAVEKEFSTIIVDADSVDQVIDTLKGTGWYYSVEIDVSVSSNTKEPMLAYNDNIEVSAQSVDAPNDPEYINQTYLQNNDGVQGLAFSNITDASNSVINKTRNVGIAVLDSAFAENDELTFTGGYSFSTAFDEERNENYFLQDGQERDTCIMHGYGVAGVMTTAINDGQTIAGIINDVDTYALRVMNCGSGYLSDSAAALNYLAKQDVTNAPMFTGHVEVANMSLSGPSETCPSYMQDAIDNANKAGITVVVAAGNDNSNASGFTPGNCTGVIVVGALSKEGERANISNYGDNVNLAAQGMDILSFGVEEKTVYWWEGTSFATPLVSASVALAKRDAPSIAPSTMRWLVENTTSALKDSTGECQTYGCGSGLLDAKALVLAAQKAEQGELSTIRHVLAEKSTCDQQWYIDHFGAKAKLCNMYRVSFYDGFTSKNTTFRLLRVKKGDNIANGDEILRAKSSSVLLQDIDTSLYDYGFETCENTVCSIDTYQFHINETEMKSPAACTESK